jgi:glycosyltransferase involved in cell wall biosynthesis
MTARRTKAERPKVVLVMIVRDEAAIIEERLKAVRDEIDAWVIVDTGSTDETTRLILDTIGDLPGTLARHDWAGFADARTYAVERRTGRRECWEGSRGRCCSTRIRSSARWRAGRLR